MWLNQLLYKVKEAPYQGETQAAITGTKVNMSNLSRCPGCGDTSMPGLLNWVLMLAKYKVLRGLQGKMQDSLSEMK